MSTFRVLLAASLALGICGKATAAPTVPLISGQPRTFNLPANSFTNSFYVDVPASSQRLTIDLVGDAAAGDIDLLLSSAAPFPDSVGGSQPNNIQLFDVAQYFSQSVESSEKLVIGRSNVFPVRAGRWYISVLNLEPARVAAPTITATLSDSPPGAVPIELVFNDTSDDCKVAEWDSAISRAPAGGNSGTTLGQQRRIALAEAARLIGSTIKSDLPIRVQACWDDLGTGSTFTLASAGPGSLLRDFPWVPRRNTWYAPAPATKLGGARSCGLAGGNCNTTYDIQATFNDRVDSTAIVSDFYYGIAGGGPSGSVDFIAVALHEIVHGLGFISGVNTRSSAGPVGQKLEGRDDAFSQNLVVVGANETVARRFLDGTDAERGAAIIGNDQLRWDDSRAVTSIFNNRAAFAAPTSYIQMYTPDPIMEGSSLSHVSERHTGDLMRAFVSNGQRTLQLSGPMLEAVGWGTAGATNELPPSNNLFDVRRDGHGIDFTRANGSVYVLTFYSYGANGEPEWFQSVGNVANGIFTAAPDANGKNLIRYDYISTRTPPQRAVSSESGSVSLNFNSPATQAPCNDGRGTSNVVAVMTFSLGTDQNVSWCMENVVSPTARATPNYSGLWHAGGADDGWGWSLLNFRANNQDGMFGLLFYYDANGRSTFAYTQTGTFSVAAQYPVIHRRGYCRSCATGPFTDLPAGTVTFGRQLQTTPPSPPIFERVTYDVTPQNSVGGRFARTDSPFVRITPAQ